MIPFWFSCFTQILKGCLCSIKEKKELESVGPPVLPGPRSRPKYNNIIHSSQKQPASGSEVVQIFVAVRPAGRISHLRSLLAIFTSIEPPYPLLWPALKSANYLKFSICNIINIRGAVKWDSKGF